MLCHMFDFDIDTNSDDCLRKLLTHSPQYEKEALADSEKQILIENMPEAIERAKRLEEYKNPSTLVYRLIEAMERG